MSARTQREKQKSEVRRLILDAAREALARHGHESLSMRKLAETIEYAPGTLYLYFRDKDDLLHALVEESFAKLLELLPMLGPGADPVCALKAGLRAYVDFGLRHPNHYKFAFLIDGRRGSWKPHRAFDVLRSYVAACLRQRRFRPIDVETASQGLWATVHGVTSLLITRPHFPWVEKKKLIVHVIDTAVDGLMAGRSSQCQPASLAKAHPSPRK